MYVSTFVKVEVRETVEGGEGREFTAGVFVRGDDTDHGGIVSDEFFGVGDIGGETVFFGYGTS